MGWIRVSLDAVIIICEAMKKADILDYLQSKADQLVQREARKIVPTILDRLLLQSPAKIARRDIAKQFEAIFKHPNFAAFLKIHLDGFDQAIFLPLIEKWKNFPAFQKIVFT